MGDRVSTTTAHSASQVCGGAEGNAMTVSPCVWKQLSSIDRCALIVGTASAAAILFPRVVWGPCFGDPGEVQLTAAVGGIGHPPGQAGVITLFRLLTFVSPFEPHLTVSAANACLALACVAILMTLQLRSGVDPLAAVVAAGLFLVDDLFWHAAVVPETYATYYLLLSASIWAFFSWLHAGRWWKFWLSAWLFAFLAVNRGPTATFSVCFVAVALLDDRARSRLAPVWPRTLLKLATLFAVCLAVVVAGLWIRDVPGCGYNYLDQSHPSQSGFPAGNGTAADKWQRLWWLITARQYDYMFHPTAKTMTAQARWLLVELGAQYWPVMLGGFAVVAAGARALWRRNRSAAVFVLLMIPASIVPVLLIRVVSNTAMLPNLLFALGWLFGLGLTRLLRAHGSAMWKGSVLAVVGLLVWFTADGGFLREKTEFDARSYVAQIDLHALPPHAALIAFDILPLVYEQRVHGVRPDIDILLHYGRLTRPYLETLQRPLFTTEPRPADLDAEWIGSGPVWEVRLRPVGR